MLEKEIDGELLKIPEHVAIIMDGNGRWAKAQGKPRNAGHLKGSQRVEEILPIADEIGIKYFTVYAFSTENWKRPQAEIIALMKILEQYLKDSIKKVTKNNMVIKVIGDRSKLSDSINKKINELEEISAYNTGLHFNIAINYGGRDDIVRASRKIVEDIQTGIIQYDNINEELFNRYLDTKGIPDPDLLIRTSGEIRLSNYMMWQLAYTEFYFTNIHWPDFGREELMKAIRYFNNKDRRFGAI